MYVLIKANLNKETHKVTVEQYKRENWDRENYDAVAHLTGLTDKYNQHNLTIETHQYIHTYSVIEVTNEENN